MIAWTGLGRAARFAWIVIAILPIGACVAVQAEMESGPSALDLSRLTAPEPAPPLIARTQAQVGAISAAADEADAARLDRVVSTRKLEVSALPWLRASPQGAYFLASGAPRALARGEPPASCPAAAHSPYPPQATSRIEAARAALDGCFAELRRRGADASCGCRLVAVDDVLLAPLESFSFAPVVSALMMGPDGPQRLVAELLHPLGDAEIVSLRDPKGEVARIALLGEEAELAFLANPERRYVGSREPFGYRRGRLAERISLTGPDGERVKLLIGVEARDVEGG